MSEWHKDVDPSLKGVVDTIDALHASWQSVVRDAVAVERERCARLRAENERLRAALTEIADGDAYRDGPVRFVHIAREALK